MSGHSLRLVRRIAARPEIVFAALVTPEGIRQWFGPDGGPVLVAEIDARVGGRYRIRFRSLDGSEHESYGEYLEFVRPVRLVMSWCWLGRESDGESRVTVELTPLDGGTELVFTHAQLVSDSARRKHEAGWNGSLDRLVAHLRA